MTELIPYWMNESLVLYHCDFKRLLSHLDDESVDLVATDPPYESLKRWEGIGTTARMGLGRKGSKSFDPEKLYETIPNYELAHLLSEIYRVLKPNRHAYVMTDGATLPFFLGQLLQCYSCKPCIYADEWVKIKFSNVKILVWDKVNLGMGYHYRSQHEYILMLDKGKNRRLADLGVGDVLRFKAEGQMVPTQKPYELFKLLVRQSTNPGEVVVDPFVGSGTTLVAAHVLGRKGIGGDIDEAHCQIAVRRLELLFGCPPLPGIEEPSLAEVVM